MNAVIHQERIDATLYAERVEAGWVGWGEALRASGAGAARTGCRDALRRAGAPALGPRG